jgi:hypothetical protein
MFIIGNSKGLRLAIVVRLPLTIAQRCDLAVLCGDCHLDDTIKKRNAHFRVCRNVFAVLYGSGKGDGKVISRLIMIWT